jgi:large subunit ribosomal protein L22
MHAHLHSARLAPKKANIMAKMVRGLPVPTAVELLRKTHKKSARLFEGVLRSAIANAEHNFKQDPQTMVVKTVVVNQGTAYRRGIPMARGRMRPIRKFLCHISITLGYPGVEKPVKKAAAKAAPKAEAPKAAAKPKTATKKPASSSSSK